MREICKIKNRLHQNRKYYFSHMALGFSPIIEWKINEIL